MANLLKGYKNSKTARNQAVGEAGNIKGYSNGLPGLIKRVEGLIDRLLKIESDIGDVEELKTSSDPNTVAAINRLGDVMGEYQWDLVYVNENPSAAYGNTTIAIGSEYVGLVVTTTEGVVTYLDVNTNHVTSVYNITTSAGSMICYLRSFTLENNILTIEHGYRRQYVNTNDGLVFSTSSNFDTHVIPLKIYGLRKKSL